MLAVILSNHRLAEIQHRTHCASERERESGILRKEIRGCLTHKLDKSISARPGGGGGGMLHMARHIVNQKLITFSVVVGLNHAKST